MLALLAARLLLGFIFITSAMGKWRNLAQFRAGLADYRLLPGWAIRPAALALPPLELGLGLLLLAGLGLLLAGLGAALVLGLFSGAIAINLVRGRRINCQCHGLLASRAIGWGLVLRNLALLGLALSLALLPGPAWPHITWMEWALVAALVGGTLALLAFFSSSVDENRPLRDDA
jgi:uncharacterized membrane protein YphA (DoxX/SURF4 family)